MSRMTKAASILMLVVILLAQVTGAIAQEAAPLGEYPIPGGEGITLTVGIIQTTGVADYETNYFTQMIERQTGVKLDFITYPADNITGKVTNILSTHDIENLPDIFLTAVDLSTPNTIFSASNAPMWYDEGMIIPLNDLIEQYGDNTKAALELAKGYGYDILPWITSPDGNVYSLPSFSASLTNAFPHKLWINQGWLDALGLEMPTTTEEFREVLRAFKEDDPNGNGINDEIPFTGSRGRWFYGYDNVLNAFVYNASSTSRMYVEDGVVHFAPVEDAWRNAMIYLRELCDEGLYYSETFTQDNATVQQIATNENDILGVFEGLSFDQVAVTNDQSIIDRYTFMPALIGPDGAHFVTFDAPNLRPGGIITTKCEYPEIAFRVLDAMMAHDAAVVSRYGEKGVNWDDAEPGTLSYYNTPAMIRIVENTWGKTGQNQHFSQHSPFILDPGIAKGVQWSGNEKEPGFVKAQSVLCLEETGVVPNQLIANLVFTPEENEAVQTPRIDIDSFILQSIANFVAGDWDPTNDAQWESYVKEYERMGLPVYLETVQTVFDRMNKN